jgi:amino acid transporter
VHPIFVLPFSFSTGKPLRLAPLYPAQQWYVEIYTRCRLFLIIFELIQVTTTFQLLFSTSSYYIHLPLSDSDQAQFFVDGVYASGCLALLIVIFLLIHYTTPPKPWGDVSQSLIYHQVRKYLLRLKQEHVKFWRPQIMLFVNDPRRQYKLIQFCNSLKKGGLFVLGHVIISPDFGAAVPEARRQQESWTRYIDFSKIKAFVNITISPVVCNFSLSVPYVTDVKDGTTSALCYS